MSEKKVQDGPNGSARWVHWPEKAGWGRIPVRFPTQTEKNGQKQVRLNRGVGTVLLRLEPTVTVGLLIIKGAQYRPQQRLSTSAQVGLVRAYTVQVVHECVGRGLQCNRE